MKQFVVSPTTREYLWEPVSLTATDLSFDLTTRQVDMALVAVDADPGDSDWKPAAWYVQPSGQACARIMLGTAIPLTRGDFDAYLRIDLGAERPVRKFAKIYVR